MTQNLFAGFFQDDWRITKAITLNLGLRYELQGVPSDSNNQLGNFEPGVGLEQVGKNIGSLYNKDATNFAPRVGVAWDLSGKGTTVIRGGFAIVYDLLSMSTFLSQQNTNNTVTLGANVVPTGAVLQINGVSTPGIGNIVASGITLPASELNWNGSSVGGAGIYPSNLVSQVTCGDGLTVGEVTDAGPCDIFSMDRNYKTPYVTTWTLGIQHAFSGKLSLDAAYVGNHGSRLTGIQDINQRQWVLVGRRMQLRLAWRMAGLKQPRDLSPSTANIPTWDSSTTTRTSIGQTTTACNWHLPAAIGMAWTLLPAIPMLTQSTISPTIGISICLKTARIQPGEYGNSDFDIRHRFTLSATYTIPGKKGYAQMLEGWQVNGILTLQSGQPWQAFDTSNDFSGTAEFADRWNIFGSPANFKSRRATVDCRLYRRCHESHFRRFVLLYQSKSSESGATLRRPNQC